MNGNTDEVFNDLIDDVFDTVLSGVGSNSWVKADVSVSQVNSDVEHWEQLVMLIVVDVDLVSQEVHGSLNTDGNTLNDETINVVNVSQPGVRFLVWSDVVNSILHEFVNFFSVSLDFIESWSDSSIVLLYQIIWSERLVPSVEEWLGPVLHHLLHFLDVVFHLLDLSVNDENLGHALLDEWLNVLRVPSQGVETWLEQLVQLVDSVLHKWLLNWQES